MTGADEWLAPDDPSAPGAAGDRRPPDRATARRRHLALAERCQDLDGPGWATELARLGLSIPALLDWLGPLHERTVARTAGPAPRAIMAPGCAWWAGTCAVLAHAGATARLVRTRFDDTGATIHEVLADPRLDLALAPAGAGAGAAAPGALRAARTARTLTRWLAAQADPDTPGPAPAPRGATATTPGERGAWGAERWCVRAAALGPVACRTLIHAARAARALAGAPDQPAWPLRKRFDPLIEFATDGTALDPDLLARVLLLHAIDHDTAWSWCARYAEPPRG